MPSKLRNLIYGEKKLTRRSHISHPTHYHTFSVYLNQKLYIADCSGIFCLIFVENSGMSEFCGFKSIFQNLVRQKFCTVFVLNSIKFFYPFFFQYILKYNRPGPRTTWLKIGFLPTLERFSSPAGGGRGGGLWRGVVSQSY